MHMHGDTYNELSPDKLDAKTCNGVVLWKPEMFSDVSLRERGDFSKYISDVSRRSWKTNI